MPTIEPFWREWRELGAARRLVLAIAAASSDPLLKPSAGALVAARVAAVCDAVQRWFERLARDGRQNGPSPEQRLRQRLSRLARACGLAGREGRDRLLGTAATLWGDAVARGRLQEKLERRAQALAEDGGGAKFQRVLMDVLWEAETGDGIATRQRRRNWKGVRDVSLELLPGRDHDAERCAPAHFGAVADRIRETRRQDRNLPRTPEAVGELFYLFSPCCVGVADPRLPGYAGPVQGHGGSVHKDDDAAASGAVDAVGSEPSPDEVADAVLEAAPDGAAALVAAFRATVAALPVRDQVILSNLLGTFDLLGRAAKRAYPTLDAAGIDSRDRTAAALGITWQELSRERQRMDEWLADVGSELQRDLTPTQETE